MLRGKWRVERVARGYRRAEDKHLFKQATDDPSIQPDRVTARVEGYFRAPAIWIGDRPDDPSASSRNPGLRNTEALARQLRTGIETRVMQDGTFLFDFGSWSLAPQVVIPGYRVPSPGAMHRPPVETENASSLSERYALLRAQAMNAHQSCLATSEWLLRGTSHGVGLPLTAADTLKGMNFVDCLRYGDGSRDIRSIYRDTWNHPVPAGTDGALQRRTLDVEVVHHSLDTFDDVLAADNAASLIQMVEAVYLATCRYTEGRFGEAITLAWGACEQLLSKLWDSFLTETQASGRLTRQRRSRLAGRDFTASMKSEALELGSCLRYDLYREVDTARKARNQWAHEMTEPSVAQLAGAMAAAEGLFEEVYGIQLRFPLNAGSPGVPAWNVWIAKDGSDRENSDR